MRLAEDIKFLLRTRRLPNVHKVWIERDLAHKLYVAKVTTIAGNLMTIARHTSQELEADIKEFVTGGKHE
jgi:hypothetical protein